MCAPSEAWRLPRSPSHDSITTDLSLFSVSSAASDAKLLRILQAKSGLNPESLRGSSPNPDAKINRSMRCLHLCDRDDSCRQLLLGCAALCSVLGLQRSFSAGDLRSDQPVPSVRSWWSQTGLSAALEARALGAASRSCSTWVAVGGSRLPSPQRAAPPPPSDLLADINKKSRQSYIRRRLSAACRALERFSQSDLSVDKREAATLTAGPTTLAVPARTRGSTSPHPVPDENAPQVKLFPNAMELALTAADLERERGRVLSKYERNMMIFNWLHTLDESQIHYAM